ncbi:MAG: hypothetical protein HQ582_15835 [Planctomycetes bacterium]|nr:hypothetical protein [Planctomycetota bacterium]
MGTNRRRRRQGRRQDWNDDHRRGLLRGMWFFPDTFGPHCGGCHGEPHWSKIEAAWDDLRDELLQLCIGKRPGHRPAAWWWFDLPTGEWRRRHVSGHDSIADLPDEKQGDPRALLFGVHNAHGAEAFKRGIVVESQPAFLARLGLLTDAEKAALGAYPETETLCEPTPHRTREEFLAMQRERGII